MIGGDVESLRLGLDPCQSHTPGTVPLIAACPATVSRDGALIFQPPSSVYAAAADSAREAQAILQVCWWRVGLTMLGLVNAECRGNCREV